MDRSLVFFVAALAGLLVAAYYLVSYVFGGGMDLNITERESGRLVGWLWRQTQNRSMGGPYVGTMTTTTTTTTIPSIPESRLCLFMQMFHNSAINISDVERIFGLWNLTGHYNISGTRWNLSRLAWGSYRCYYNATSQSCYCLRFFA